MLPKHTSPPQAEDCLRLEEERVDNYLHASTKVRAARSASWRSLHCELHLSAALQASQHSAVLLRRSLPSTTLHRSPQRCPDLLLATQPKLLKAVEEEVLSKYEAELLQKEHSGAAALLRDDKVRAAHAAACGARVAASCVAARCVAAWCAAA